MVFVSVSRTCCVTYRKLSSYYRWNGFDRRWATSWQAAAALIFFFIIRMTFTFRYVYVPTLDSFMRAVRANTKRKARAFGLTFSPRLALRALGARSRAPRMKSSLASLASLTVPPPPLPPGKNDACLWQSRESNNLGHSRTGKIPNAHIVVLSRRARRSARL